LHPATAISASRGRNEIKGALVACITTDKILRDEANAIHGSGTIAEPPPGEKPLEGSDLYRKLLSLNSAALCISGGGIRSASFSQGVIEALACHPRPQETNETVGSAQDSLLAQFNYLSTVSGGGYVGSWLSAWVTRAHRPGGGGWPAVWTNLTGNRSNPDQEAPQIRWLRTYSNYLTPRIGLTSADTWTGVAIFLRNLILNWLVLLPLLVAVLLALKLLAIAVLWTSMFDPHEARPAIIVLALAMAGLLLALWFSNHGRPSHGRSRVGQNAFLRWQLAPGWVATLLFTFVLASPAAENVMHDELFSDGGMSKGALLRLAAAGAALYAASWIIAWPRNAKTLIWDFACWTISGAVFGSLVMVGIYLYYFAVPDEGPWPFQPKEILLLTATVPWIIVSGLIAEMIFVGLTKDLPGSDSDREWLGRAAGWYLLVALGWPIAMTLVFVGSNLANAVYGELKTWILAGGAGTITALLGSSSATPATGDATGWKALSANVILAIAATIFAVLLIIGFSALLDEVLFGKALVNTPMFDEAVSLYTTPPWPGGWKVPVVLVLVLIVGAIFSWRVNINRFSLHALYRNRIIRGFLGASNPARRPNPFTGFDDADNLRVWELWPRDASTGGVGPRNWRPFHVVNMALNLTKGEELAWQERKAESFTASPLHSGSSKLGYRDSKTYGDDQGISLGTAVAISGAAASPNMGYHSSPALAFLLTLFNVRLGWWLGNPGGAGENTYTRSGPRFAIKPLLSELFGETTNASSYVYLSDGGHFENLALYEMVRRRCRYIVAIDAGCDKEYAFADLGNAVRKIRIDLGISITFANLKALRFREEQGVEYKENEPPFYAVGIIHYPEAASIEQQGIILYIKPSFLDGRITDAGVRNYATANPDFPHQSTANQWFSESQLESYRALGLEMMDSVLCEIVHKANCPPSPKLRDIFAALR
jgi:hypothetical protein